MYQYIYLKPHQVKLDNIQQIGANELLGSDATGDIIPVTVGSGLSLNSGTISATGTGTVTSIAVDGANGIGVSGSPITSSGTISLTLGTITGATWQGNSISTTYTDAKATAAINSIGSGLSLSSGTLSSTATAYSAAQTEVDFGSTPVSSSTFTITDANVSSSSKIIAQLAGVAPTGKSVDEALVESLDIKCSPSSGSLSMYIQTYDGSFVSGKFKVNYMVSA